MNNYLVAFLRTSVLKIINAKYLKYTLIEYMKLLFVIRLDLYLLLPPT